MTQQVVRELKPSFPNTVSKAYKALEQDGVIYSVVGKGSFVSDKFLVISGKKVEAIKNVTHSIASAMKLGVLKKEITDVVNNVYSKE